MVVVTKVEGKCLEGKANEIARILNDLKEFTLGNRQTNGNLSFVISFDVEENTPILHVYEEWDTEENMRICMSNPYHQEVMGNVMKMLAGPVTMKGYQTTVEDNDSPCSVVAIGKLHVQDGKVNDVASVISEFKDIIRENHVFNGNEDYQVSVDLMERNVVHVFEEWKTMADLKAYEEHSSHAEFIDGKVRPSLSSPASVSIYQMCPIQV